MKCLSSIPAFPISVTDLKAWPSLASVAAQIYGFAATRAFSPRLFLLLPDFLLS